MTLTRLVELKFMMFPGGVTVEISGGLVCKDELRYSRQGERWRYVAETPDKSAGRRSAGRRLRVGKASPFDMPASPLSRFLTGVSAVH